jgi:TetR/AcrR family transcriptional regulator, mexCD-oprJ operon repressor
VFEKSGDTMDVVTNHDLHAGSRAEARRNVVGILDAASPCLARDPSASLADIAREAGVGGVTLYGHFDSRST